MSRWTASHAKSCDRRQRDYHQEVRLETVTYTGSGGWSSPLPTSLDSPQTLVLAFGPSELLDDAAPLRELTAAFPSSLVTGCSTGGAVLGTKMLDHTIVVSIARFERSTIRMASRVVSEGGASHDVGAGLAGELMAPGLRGVFVLSDGLIVNGSELAEGFNSALPDDVVVTGGLAGDDERFLRTWVLQAGGAEQHRVTAIGFYGDHVRFEFGSRGGWDIFGRERRVTRSEGSTVFEIDGQPALDLYKNYLGDFAGGLPATGLLFPLALLRDEQDRDPVVRTLLGIDEAARALRFAGNVPQGALVRLMRTNLDRIIDAATDAAEQARGDHPGEARVLSIAVSCVGRRWVLGQRTDEELENVLAELPPATAQAGFYSYGELSPRSQGRCDLHNQTMTLTTISER